MPQWPYSNHSEGNNQIPKEIVFRAVINPHNSYLFDKSECHSDSDQWYNDHEKIIVDES